MNDSGSYGQLESVIRGIELRPGQIITDMVVVAKVVSDDNQSSVSVGVTEGTDYITRVGLITILQDVEDMTRLEPADGDDD